MRSKVKTDPGADMRIGDLAEQSGLAPTALRYYEKAGLLPAPHRTASRYRVLEQDLAAIAEYGAHLNPAECDPSGICKVIPIETDTPTHASLASAVQRQR